MSTIKTNERELASQVKGWFNDVIRRSGYSFPFKEATVETGVKIISKTRFGDIFLWIDRKSEQAHTYIELKPPFKAKEDLNTFREKANQIKPRYAITWDFQTLNIYLPSDGYSEPKLTETVSVLRNISDWLRGDIQAIIKAYISRICDELENIDKTGKLSKFKPDKVYFVRFIKYTVEKLLPLFEDFISSEYGKQDTRKKIIEYIVKQGYIFKSKDENIKFIAKHRVYGFITKIVFYLTIRKYFDELPDLLNQEENDLNRILRVAFTKAHEKDWHAVFKDDFIEELGIPKIAFSIVRDFLSELRAYHFENLADDVVGELFEEIIEPEQRHDLGQYFTSENLVDLILGAIVLDKDSYYCDPTCGSGTFLIRLYDRLQYLNSYRIKHEEILERIWGIDIGKFPSELSTINLFRQEPMNYINFPRIINKDIFKITKGETFEFPPPNAGKEFSKIEKRIPEFRGIVGNFPYIRQELIEKIDKGYKKYLTKVLANEYLFKYRKLFETKGIKDIEFKKVKNDDEEKRIKQIDRWVNKGNVKLRLSGQADIYAYIFIHTATLLSENGAFGIITSNSWLDVSYGTILKEFFLDNFKIKMIIASWAEPWFEDASVNTVISILEKEKDEDERKENFIHFVKLKKKLSEIIKYNDLILDRHKRWNKIEDIISFIENSEYNRTKQQITNSISTVENDDYRIRMVKQEMLKKEITDETKATKWMQYLRAPDVYFEILEKCKNKFKKLNSIAEIKFGIKTGINDFFYLEDCKIKTKGKESIYKNSRGWKGFIEKEYLKKVIKSPKETESIIINKTKLKNLLFICNKSKEELKKLKHNGALKYIEWGESQKTEMGIQWIDVPSVQGRDYWYSIQPKGKYDLLMSRFYDKRFVFPDLKGKLLAGDTFFVFASKKKSGYKNKIFLNSSIYHLFVEILARSNMGDGVLTFYGPDIEDTFLIKDEVEIKLGNDIDRRILAIFEEVKQKDRRQLDSEILKALNLEPKEYLQRIYDGLCEMVRERLELPKMRKKRKKQSEKNAYEDIKESVIEDCIPDGVRKFPEAFYTDTKKYFSEFEFESIPISGKKLHYEEFLGHYVIFDEDKKEIFKTDEIDKADYILIESKKSNKYMIEIPKDINIVSDIMKNFHSYLRSLKDQLKQDANSKLHDWALTESMVKEILEEQGLG